MSAETQHRSASVASHVVLPQPVTDRSIIESVTGFITEVVPQVSAAAASPDSKDVITWARFEAAECGEGGGAAGAGGAAPLLLVLGYGSGVQVWAVRGSGEASEVLSWRRGVVRTLRVLPPPEPHMADPFGPKRPLVALCDSAGPGPQFCSLSFISLRVGDQVKIIKYKNAVSDVVCSRRVVVVAFPEKLAILDAGSLEERRAVLTCYPATGPNPNPIALGARWLAYADRKLSPSQLSAGGVEPGSGQSVTATVLHAAKSLGKGLRDLGETVASSLAGQRGAGPPGPGAPADLHPGVVTVVDTCREEPRGGEEEVVAHFVAHTDPIVAVSFDPSGMLLLTADKRGHDFHVFRVLPHPCGPSHAAVHHLYVLHRGDTSAKVQDVAWSRDSRWLAVSTLRGTTHIFPVTTYGGAVGVRTHATPHVVNRQSRFHRSAGLLAEAPGRNSPETVPLGPSVALANPRLPPFPLPTLQTALAQIRLPVVGPCPVQRGGAEARPATRQASSEEPCAIPLRVAALFSPPRGWLPATKPVHKAQKRPVDSLFVVSCSGSLIEYHLKPHHASSVPREKVCDDTAIELTVEAKAQWPLLRPPHTSELQLPLPPGNPLMVQSRPPPPEEDPEDDDHWLSQVEIVTHSGPHRRLWMGPQFVFKTYLGGGKECEAVEVGAAPGPVSLPLGSSARPVVPVLIEATSCSSLEHSPRLYPSHGSHHSHPSQSGDDSDSSLGPGDSQLAESLADAMMENPQPARSRDSSKANMDFISL